MESALKLPLKPQPCRCCRAKQPSQPSHGAVPPDAPALPLAGRRGRGACSAILMRSILQGSLQLANKLTDLANLLNMSRVNIPSGPYSLPLLTVSGDGDGDGGPFR